MRIRPRPLLSVLIISLSSLPLLAQTAPAQSGAGDKEPGHRGPPAEALAACKTLSAGAACAFTSPHGQETGTCFAPEGKPLACRPAHGAKPPRGEGAGPAK